MSEALLKVEGLNAYYGSAHVLTDVSFEVGDEAVGVVKATTVIVEIPSSKESRG